MPKRKCKVFLDDVISTRPSYNERDILDAVINYPSNKWQKILEYDVLNNHIESGGDFRDIDYFYSKIDFIAKHRNGEGCKLIYAYVRKVLKRRLPYDIENKLYRIFWQDYKTSKVGYKYAKYVVRGKLPVEFEVGCNNFDYVNFLYNKHLEYDNVLMNSSVLSYLFYRYNYFLPDIVHNSMMAKHMIGDRSAIIYFKQRRKDDKIIKNRLSVMDGSKTVSEIINNLN